MASELLERLQDGVWLRPMLANVLAVHLFRTGELGRALFERVGADLGVQRAERVLRRLGVLSPTMWRTS